MCIYYKLFILKRLLFTAALFKLLGKYAIERIITGASNQFVLDEGIKIFSDRFLNLAIQWCGFRNKGNTKQLYSNSKQAKLISLD